MKRADTFTRSLRFWRILPLTWIFGAVVAGWILFSHTAWCDVSANAEKAFSPGERLTFLLKWTVIPAGEAVLEVMPQERKNGIHAHRFVLTARTNEFVDAFYVVRDRIESWTDVSISRSLHYRKKQHEGNKRRDINVFFDWEKKTAQYENRGNARDPISIADGTFDPLSVFYWFRSKELAIGDRIERMVTDGKKKVLGMADVVRKERIQVPAGVFDTFLIEPDFSQVGGVFEKSPDATIQVWVSADRRRLPVKLKSKVVVGSFTGELVSITGAEPLPPKP